MDLFQENTFYLSSTLFARHFSYDELVTFLNNGQLDKHPLFTPTYLCGQYVYYYATSIEEINKPSTINKRVFKSEFGFLKKLGVNFDEDMALKYAVNFKRMLDNESAILKWY